MTLSVEAKFPDFSLPDQNGSIVSRADFSGRWLVVFFYPADDTTPCTLENKAFSAARGAFAERGVSLVGVSQDSSTSHSAFCAKNGITTTLLADTNKDLIHAAQIREASWSGGKYWTRTTIIVDPDGTVAKVYEEVTPEGHDAQVLGDIIALQNARMTRSGGVSVASTTGAL